MMFKRRIYIIVLVLCFLACDKEKEEDLFTSNVDTSVTNNDVVGTWFVFAAEFMGNVVEIPASYPECGDNFIVFSNDGVYEEVIFERANCIPIREFANWKIENGVIVVTYNNGEEEKLPIIEYGPSELVVNLQYDLDNDGAADIFTAYLKPYDPIANDYVAKSFERDSNESTLLKFNWKQESEVSSFANYKIYRSQKGICSKEDAILLTEIKDIATTTFIDYSPPPTDGNLCYFLKVYSNNGLAGESELLVVDPGNLEISDTLSLTNVSVDGEHILLDWSELNIPYFSHYEIVYANSDATNLLFHEEDSLVSIDSFEETSFLNTDPPYLENPYFAVYAYNIFGANVVSNYEQVTFRRKDLIGPIYLKHIEVDETEPVVYLYGSSQIPDWTSYDANAVLRFNYGAGLLESTTSEEVYVAGEFPFRKPINFPEGKELVINGRTNFHFLDPTSLRENFSFGSFYLQEEFDLFGVVDFTYTNNGFFVVIDTDSIFVFQRNAEELVLLDKQIHYEVHHGDNLYRILQVNDGEVLVGHKREAESIAYTIGDNGLLQNRRVVSLPFSSSYIQKYQNTSFYSALGNSLINYADRTLYSTRSFQPEIQMPEDLFALGIAQDGKYVFASTINPDWFGSDVKTNLLKREVLFFDTATQEIEAVKTKGYPIRVFENNIGEIFAISIPENQTITDFDVFVEKIDFR